MTIGNQKGDMLSNVYPLILRLFFPVFTFYFVFQPKFAKIIDIIGGGGRYKMQETDVNCCQRVTAHVKGHT